MKPLTPRDPKEIGGYTLVNRLGSGGMGEVYLAVKDRRNVALKIIRDAFVDDPAYIARFQREINTLKSVSHPNVIEFIESGIDDGRVWYTSEFAGGPDLHHTLQTNGPLQGYAWWDLAQGLVSGLSAIHEQNTVHRDIKPANIIMSPFGAKIIDLGIAKGDDETSLTQTGMAPGTPAWFSPEHLDGREVTAASDFYSAGAVLVFAATGNTPWGPPTSVTYHNIGQKMSEPPDLSALDDAQRQFVSGLLDPGPSDRLAHAKRIRNTPPPPLTRPLYDNQVPDPSGLVDEPKGATESAQSTVQVKKSGSNLLVAFGFLVALLVSATGLGYFLWTDSSEAGISIADARTLARDLDNQERRALSDADSFIDHVRTNNYPQFFRYGFGSSWGSAEGFTRANWEINNLGDWFGLRWDIDSIEPVSDLTIPATACSDETTFTNDDSVDLFRMHYRDDPNNFTHMAVKDGVPYFFYALCQFAPQPTYGESLRLARAWEADLRLAIDAGVDDYLAFIRETNYPGLYDFESERWLSGEDAVRRDWRYVDFFFDFDYKSAGIVDLEIIGDSPGCEPSVTYFPTTLWILEISPDGDQYTNYFVIEDGVLYNMYAICRIVDEDELAT